MGVFLAVGVALVASLGAVLLARMLPGWRQRVGRGGPVWLGLALGLLILWLRGETPMLVLILLVAALVAGLVETGLQLAGAHWLFRLAAHGLIIAATMGLEYQRGDLFAITAAVGVVGGVVVFNLVAFATRAAQLSGAGRTPPLLALLGAAYLLVIAQGLPNPGLTMLLLVVAAAVLPQAVLASGGLDVDRALAPVLAAVAWVTGFYAWLANASPAMVLTPLAIVGLDVAWTLVRRLVTVPGRTRLAAAGNWWRGIAAWAEPADDLVAQRAALASSRPAAVGWLLGFTVAALLLSLAQWQLAVGWVPAAAAILLLALGWLLIQCSTIGLPRPILIAWLCGLTVAAGVLTYAAHLTDGRRLVTLLPLAVVAAVWVAAVPVLRGLGNPAAEAQT